MEKSKILFVSQEITPYLPETEMSLIGRQLPQGIQEKGKEIRTFMPKFGAINERRNHLHEVIRLSGMNLVIDDTDHPLIIKVASIQSARMQVYFIDNDDFFYRKSTVVDDDGHYFEDNDERAIFFTRGVIETVRKLRWAPDVVHCHGWFSAFMPLYLKKAFADDPMFSNTKVVYSIYEKDFPGTMNEKLAEKLIYEGISSQDVALVKDKPDFVNVSKLAIKYSDGVIAGSQTINSELERYANELELPILSYQNEDEYVEQYDEFYDKVLEENFEVTS